MRYYDQYRLYGEKLPQGGGTFDQPVTWHLLMGLALGAEARVRREKDEAERLEREQGAGV